MEKQIKQDYGFALLTLAWVTSNDNQYLVFGALEFFPKDLIECCEVKKNSLILDQKDDLPQIILNFCRTKLSCEEALNLYDSCRMTGKIVLPSDSIEILIKEDTSVPFIEFNQWPNFTVDKRSSDNLCPFLAEAWGCCRMHNILPNNILPPILMVAEHEKTIQWLKERLLWDISMYPELLGSMHLILPNPLLRSVTERLIPDSPNKVAVFIELRDKLHLEDLADIKIIVIERGIFGLRNVEECVLSGLDNPSFNVTTSGNNTEEFAIAIYDKVRGLLEWTTFGSFIQGFDIELRVADARRKICMPGSEDSFEITSYESVDKIKQTTPEEWGQRLYFQQIKRIQGRNAKKYGQHLFKHGNKQMAEAFIRELIQQARKRVIIIDPFFATLELFKYVLAISSPVDITIITGADAMKSESNYSVSNEEYIRTGQEIINQIENFKKKLTGYTINVDVMTGNNVFHDRFLIIDDQVWFSGNSLNKIGSRASMLIRLPNPYELLDYLDELKTNKDGAVKRIIPLEDWLKKREG